MALECISVSVGLRNKLSRFKHRSGMLSMKRPNPNFHKKWLKYKCDFYDLFSTSDPPGLRTGAMLIKVFIYCIVHVTYI
jgi:hypothetical protein